MTLYSDPPPLLSFSQVKPTLLVCWWITIFCTTIIFFRLAGRYVRTERLFREDKTAALSLVPLLLRMGFVHLILTYGTNNTDFSEVQLTDEEVRQKSVGSGLVLASRILHAATLWILKCASLDFLKRIIGVTWTKSYTRMLLYIRFTLLATFIAVVISDLAECQPFAHYWQVLPDPGGQCRQGYAQLLTVAVCNVFTDLLLVLFPIPIILRSAMTVRRKGQLITLFSLSLAVVAATLYRVPNVISAQGTQHTRSLLASVELLFATSATNALVLGSFVRDRGVKKRKFKYGSFADSTDRGGRQLSGAGARRPTLHHHWGSDEDLVRELGLGVEPSLRNGRGCPEMDEEAMLNRPKFTPAPPVAPDMSHWRFPSSKQHSEGSGASFQKRANGVDAGDGSILSRENMDTSPGASRSNSTASPRKVSFFEPGGLVDEVGAIRGGGPRRDSYNSSIDPLTPMGSYGPLSSGPPLMPALPASNSGLRRGSTALLQDLGGLLPLGNSRQQRSSRSSRAAGTELQTIPQGRRGGMPSLVDVGGLLHRH